MSLTPSEVFEGRLREQGTFNESTTWRGGNGQRANRPRTVTAHTPDDYNRRQVARRPRPRTRLQYGGHTSTDSYSRVSHHTPQAAQPGASGSQETSFVEAARERHPGLRKRPTASKQGTSHTSQPPVRGTSGDTGYRRLLSDTRIHIPETFESTPLLAGTSGGAAITGSGIATGAAVAGGALLAGGATAAIVNRLKEKGATLPGSDYVGPGNDVNIDAPRHASDAIAKEHDVGYSDLIRRGHAGQLSEQEFAEGIDFLDKEAIAKFAENFHNSGEWHSFVGRWGLWIKNRVEEITGPLYPSFPGKQWVDGRTFIQKTSPIGLVCRNLRSVTL